MQVVSVDPVRQTFQFVTQRHQYLSVRIQMV